MELHAFSSLDGEDGYDDFEPISVDGYDDFDPSAMRVESRPKSFYQSPKPTEDGQLTITIDRYGAGGDVLPYQLFGAKFGIHATEDQTVFPGTKPFSYAQMAERDNALNGIDIAIQTASQLADFAAFKAALGNPSGDYATATDDFIDLIGGKVAVWLADGSLKIGNISSGVIIQCQEVPYRLLIEDLKTTVIFVRRSKFSYNSLESLDRQWLFKDKSFLGKIDQNQWIPRAYFDAYQQQSNITQIDASYWITPEREIDSTLDDDEDHLSLVMYVSRFKKNALGAGPKDNKKVAPRKQIAPPRKR